MFPGVAGLVAWRLSPHEEAVGREGGSVPGTCLSPTPLGLQQDENVALVLVVGRAGVQSWLSRAHSLCSGGVWKDSVSRGAVTVPL